MLAGNKKLKIFGTLQCSSGKRMKSEHRVFFSSVVEAKAYGFRPCGHCMRASYNQWKNEVV
ncbi:MAG: Ada metal-binding domain-containing protein [Thermonemataceae bacterium]